MYANYLWFHSFADPWSDNRHLTLSVLSMLSIPFVRRLFAFLLVVGISGLFFINFCSFIYQCGCDSLWNGAATACNVHIPAIRDCPWCALGIWGGFLSFGSVVTVQGLVLFFPSRLGFWARLGASVAVFPLVGGATGLLLGWTTGYWG